MNGELGRVYGKEQNNGYNAKAFIGKASYELNPSWKFGLDMGHISGDRGKQNDKFEALYLHPNYQIAHLMFRYNTHAIAANTGENIFDSYMTNVNFTKIVATYRTNKWVWNMGLIWANAVETAKNGSEAFHHGRNFAYKAQEDQSDSYGFEIDLDFTYEWNSNVSVLGSLGYHFVGDYYKHDNRPDTSGAGPRECLCGPAANNRSFLVTAHPLGDLGSRLPRRSLRRAISTPQSLLVVSYQSHPRGWQLPYSKRNFLGVRQLPFLVTAQIPMG